MEKTRKIYRRDISKTDTSEYIDIIGPRSSLSIPTSVRSSVSPIGEMSSPSRRTPSSMLHSEYSVSLCISRESTFLDSVSSSAVISSKKATSALQGWYGTSASVSVTADTLS